MRRQAERIFSIEEAADHLGWQKSSVLRTWQASISGKGNRKFPPGYTAIKIKNEPKVAFNSPASDEPSETNEYFPSDEGEPQKLIPPELQKQMKLFTKKDGFRGSLLEKWLERETNKTISRLLKLYKLRFDIERLQFHRLDAFRFWFGAMRSGQGHLRPPNGHDKPVNEVPIFPRGHLFLRKLMFAYQFSMAFDREVQLQVVFRNGKWLISTEEPDEPFLYDEIGCNGVFANMLKQFIFTVSGHDIREESVPTKECLYCGSAFSGRRMNARFCAEDHQVKYDLLIKSLRRQSDPDRQRQRVLKHLRDLHTQL